MKNTPPLESQVFAYVEDLDDYQDEGSHNVTFKGTSDDANVTTSKVLGKDTHKLVIDLDLPAQLLPSSTEGHFHLYVDHEIPWEKYNALLVALADADLIEPGYLGASQQRGYTSVRLPWIAKIEPKEAVAIAVASSKTPLASPW